MEEALDALREELAAYLELEVDKATREESGGVTELILWHKIPPKSYITIVRGLQSDGWSILRQHGNHLKMYKPQN
jgi:hypothetical protein